MRQAQPHRVHQAHQPMMRMEVEVWQRGQVGLAVGFGMAFAIHKFLQKLYAFDK